MVKNDNDNSKICQRKGETMEAATVASKKESFLEKIRIALDSGNEKEVVKVVESSEYIFVSPPKITPLKQSRETYDCILDSRIDWFIANGYTRDEATKLAIEEIGEYNETYLKDEER